MKIDDSLSAPTSVRRQKARKAKSKPAATSSAGDTKDSVAITQTSSTLNALEGKLSLMDASDAGKTEAIRQAVAEGRFQVDEEAVADALVQQNMQQLRSREKK